MRTLLVSQLSNRQKHCSRPLRMHEWELLSLGSAVSLVREIHMGSAVDLGPRFCARGSSSAERKRIVIRTERLLVGLQFVAGTRSKAFPGDTFGIVPECDQSRWHQWFSFSQAGIAPYPLCR